MSGTLPTELGLLTNLVSMFLTGNAFIGTLPTELANVRGTQMINPLKLDGNRLTGTIPTELFDVPSDGGNGRALDLSGNLLTGSIPSEVGKAIVLTALKLHDNLLHGYIPSEIGLLAELITLQLDQNDFQGDIPSELSALTDVTLFTVHTNAGLCGEVPDVIVAPTKTGDSGTAGTGLGVDACPAATVCCSVAYQWTSFCCLAKNLGSAVAEKFCDRHC